jgi:hypothetical protein
MPLKVEYSPTPADALAVRRCMHRRALRYPPLLIVFGGSVALVAGGFMTASIGSGVWLALVFFGLLLPALLLFAWRQGTPTLANVEQDFAIRPWLSTPYRIEVDAEGVRYEHGPFRSRVAWSAFAEVIESPEALVLLERPAPGALVYGLSKRELEKTPGGVSAWREHLSRAIRTRRIPPR